MRELLLVLMTLATDRAAPSLPVEKPLVQAADFIGRWDNGLEQFSIYVSDDGLLHIVEQSGVWHGTVNYDGVWLTIYFDEAYVAQLKIEEPGVLQGQWGYHRMSRFDGGRLVPTGNVPLHPWTLRKVK